MCRKTLLIAALIVGVVSTALVPFGTVAAMDSPDVGEERSDTPETALSSPGASQKADSSTAAPPDPDEDVIGWENGYWYNESIDVDQSDGLTDAELERFKARTMARVEKIRNLEFTENITVEFISREEMKDIARERTFGENRNDQLWEALWMIGEDENASRVHAAGTGAGVLGYAAEEGSETLVIVTKDPENPMVTPETLAHELMHMLQDQHFDLSQPRYKPTTVDGDFGKDGIVEGEATLVHKMYAQRCGATWDCVDTPSGWADSESGGNWGVSFMGYMPYSDGAVLVHSLFQEGGWEAVNEAHENPTTTSEQVIHYERMDEPPVEMSIEDRSTDEWSVKPFDGHRAERLGEVSIFMMFYYQHRTIGIPEIAGEFDLRNLDNQFDALNYSTDAAVGWGNDRFLVYENGDESGYVWKTVWDTEKDATEFRKAYEALLGANGASSQSQNVWLVENGGFADAFRVTQEGKTVTIVNGPTVDSLAKIRAPADQVTTTTTNPTTAKTTGSEGEPSDATSASTTNPGSDGETTTGSDNGGSLPGFGVGVAIVALAGVAALARRR